ncbi:MAG: RNA 2'-phosphotransferase [Acidobacteriota bacterium]
MRKKLVRISKFLSLVLRHKPEEIGIELDEQGWTEVAGLLRAAQRRGVSISREELDEVVFTNDKQRFAFSADGSRIRANQGHSVQIDLALQPQQPPAKLYHGTATRFIDAIRDQGLKKMNRQHVHLSPTTDQAHRVGSRHGKPIVLTVDCEAMAAAGYLFYVSLNGVWLTDHVPASFIQGWDPE